MTHKDRARRLLLAMAPGWHTAQSPTTLENLRNLIESEIRAVAAENQQTFMQEHWGERCQDYEAGCFLCLAWTCFDYLFGEEQVSGAAMDRLMNPRPIQADPIARHSE